MPGKPAARTGDTAMDCADPVDTPTGTVVAVGNVFINKMPAAKQNDQIVGTDIHILMMPSPTGPVPTPLPHPFTGIINIGCEPTVKIMGMPAAVVGSKATNTPPHIPQGGPFQIPPKNQATIMIGSPNVFIGGVSGGGADGDSGTAGDETNSFAFAGLDPSNVSCKVEEGHYLDVTFNDKSERPVMGAFYDAKDTEKEPFKGKTSGRILKYGIPEGDCDIDLKGIIKAEWSVKGELKTGEEVTLKVETIGVDDDEEATFEVWERDTNRQDRFMVRVHGTVTSNKAEATWTYRTEDIPEAGSDDPGTYSSPDYYFIVEVSEMKKRSGILVYRGDLEIVVENEEGKPVGEIEYNLSVATGETRPGKADGKGEVKQTDLTLRAMALNIKGLPKKSQDDN